MHKISGKNFKQKTALLKDVYKIALILAWKKKLNLNDKILNCKQEYLEYKK